MTLDPKIEKAADGTYTLTWTADPNASAYEIIAPSGAHVQAGKQATSAKLGEQTEPFTVQIAPATPAAFESVTQPPPVVVEPPPVTGEVYFTGESLTRWSAPQQKASGRAADVTSPVHLHSKAIRFEVRSGDNNVAGSGTGERCEVMIGTDKTRGRGGTELWCCFSFYLDTPRSTSDWNTIVQFHHTGTTGQAPDMRAKQGGPLVIRVYPSGNRYNFASSWQQDRWYEVVWGMYLSQDSAKGWVEGWLDGKNVLPRTKVATLYPSQGVYAKAGHYRGAYGQTDRTLIEGYCLATTKAAGVAFAFPGSKLW